MDDRRLREYALKIYSGDSDYSLQKAFRLFPKYFSKIAFFYTELLVQKQKELNTRMFQALGIDVAVKIKKYRNKILQELEDTDIYKQSFDSEYDMRSYVEVLGVRQHMILNDLKNYVTLNREALISVENTAQKYGYSDIFKEAAAYLTKNEEIFWHIVFALEDWQERTARYYYYET